MFGAFIDGLLIVLQWKVFVYMMIGAAVGFWVGILPGLGGSAAMALMIPFIYKMTPAEAIPFLLGMYSVVQTTGDITSVLFGIPGEAASVATIIDGYPMAKKGEAGRALGAALMSSLVGAVIGAVFLALAIPVVRPLVLSFGSPERFAVIIIGLTCISSLSAEGARGLLLGMMSAGFGLICSMVGQDSYGGILRYTFGQLYLYNGISLVPLVVGLFAIPEIVDLAVRETAIATDVPTGNLGRGAVEGIKDTFRHFWLTARCSMLGVFMGILPGLGGSVGQWVAYAHSVQSAKTLEEKAGFGKGDVRGVLGPGAANNSKEAGALIPTIAFGIPAGPSMAVLLGALMLMGIIPGPDMLTTYLPLTFSMVWTIVLTNILCVLASLIFLNRLARLTTIRGNLIIPFLLLLIFIGGYAESGDIGDLFLVLISGGVGYLMVMIGWPRAPFILGFIMGKLAERYLYASVSRYDYAWLYRPWVMILFLIAFAVALYPFYQGRKLRKRKHKAGALGQGGPRPTQGDETIDDG